MNIRASSEQIIQRVREEYPGVDGAMERARAHVTRSKREVWPFQAAVLYSLARRYNREGARFLEIGTAYGYSAAVLAEAAPLARIVTLNPKRHEYEKAIHNLSDYLGVVAYQECSWDFLARYRQDYGQRFQFIFVDGDHSQVREDFPWWNWMQTGGLMLFHDYSPDGGARPCPSVYEACQEFGEWLGRKPDVLVIDYEDVGMAGWYRNVLDRDWSEAD